MTRVSNLRARVRASLIAAGRGAEAAALRIASRLSFRPLLSVIMPLPSTAGPTRTVASGMETIAGELTAALRMARGRWVAVLDGDGPITPEIVASLRNAATRHAALVPVLEPEEDPVALMTAAVLTEGTAFPRAVARAAAADDGSCNLAGLRHRARALARLNRVPSPALTTSALVDSSEPSAAERIAAIAQIGTIGAPGERVRRALDRACVVLASAAGRQLRGNDQDRHALMQQYRDGHIPWQELNASAAEDLVIAYTFPPTLDTSGFVAARRLDERGRAFDVIAQDMRSVFPTDLRSLELVADDLGAHRIHRGRATASTWPVLEEYCRFGLDQIERRERELGAYRTVYSRSMWLPPSILAAWFKSRRPSVLWTAELSDPLTLRPDGGRREEKLTDSEILSDIESAAQRRGLPGPASDSLFEAVEWMVYTLADEIVFTNENQRELMLGTYPDRAVANRARSHSVIRHHPEPDQSLYALGSSAMPSLDGIVSIGYFGRFYDVRTPTDLLAPFASLSAVERRGLRMFIFTPNADPVHDAVRDSGLEDLVEVRPTLGYFDFLATARDMDWLLVADAHRPEAFPVNPYLPSKYADYRGAGAKIWGIVEPGSILSGKPLDASSPLGDESAAADVLRAIAAGSL